jgi:hypothetical protein
MKHQYYPPAYGAEQFHCPRCGVYARQEWFDLRFSRYSTWEKTPLEGSECSHCRQFCYWYDQTLIVPSTAPVEVPHPDLPEDCRPDFEEARDIFSRSPRAAAALLRLCIQKLLVHLGESGKNINDDIRSLVGKGLPVLVQRALDYTRVVGNNAVHPGEIAINDSPEIAQNLFRMINFIVEDRISRPKEIEELYEKLPQGAREAIAKRDGVTGN